MTNVCRAKNPTQCWKHGTGETTSIQGAKNALKSARTELKTATDFNEYENAKKAVEKYENRISLIKGKNLSEAVRAATYSSLVEDADQEKTAAYNRVITNPNELESITTSYSKIVEKLQKESPASTLEQFSIGSSKPDAVTNTAYKNQRNNASQIVTENEAKGYKPVSIVSIDQENTYFYKPDVNDPTNYGTWEAAQDKHKTLIEEVNAKYKEKVNAATRGYRSSQSRNHNFPTLFFS